MTLPPSIKFGILGLACIAGAAWFVSTDTTSPTTDEPGEGRGETAEAIAEQAAGTGCTFEEGDQFALHLKRRSAFWVNPVAVMDKSVSPSLAQIQSDTVSDEWIMLWQVQQVQKKGALIRMTGIPAGTPRRGTELAKLRAQTSVFLNVLPNCSFGQVGAPEGVQPALLRDWQSLLTLMEFIWPRRSGQAWSAVQTDTTGAYSAEYSLSGSGDVDRKRREYLSTVPPRPGLKAAASIVSSDATATRDHRHDWFSQIRMREHVQVDVEGAGRFADVNTTLALSVVDPPDHPFWDEVVDMDLVSWTEAHKLGGESQGGLRFSGDPVDPALVALPIDQLMATFSALLGEDRVGALRILVHWLRHSPSRAQELLDGVKMGLIPKDLHDEVFHALGMAGGPEAREALLEAASSPDLSTANRLQAMAALKGAPGVHSDTVNFLTGAWAERSDPPTLEERSGLLTVGSLLDRPDTPDDLRDELEDTLKSALADAETSEETSAALSAIGNTHDPEFADLVEPLLDDDNVQTRTAAFEAMNRIGQAPPPDEALDALIALPTTRGQKYALNALQARAEDATDEDIQWAIHLLNEPGTTVYQRGALIQFLGALADRPVARAALIAWFAVETDPDLLVLIGKYISGGEL